MRYRQSHPQNEKSNTKSQIFNRDLELGNSQHWLQKMGLKMTKGSSPGETLLLGVIGYIEEIWWPLNMWHGGRRKK